MGIFLQLAGVLGIIAILVVVVIAVLFIKKLKILLSMQEQPNRIHLKPSREPDWADRKKVEEAKKSLTALGFTDLGKFSVDEMPLLKLHGFIDSKAAAIAVIYEMPTIGVFFDLVRNYGDGSTLTVSSNLTGGELKQRAEHKIIRFAGAGIEDLYGKLKENDKGEYSTELEETPDAFCKKFEKAYADEMDWRNCLGGPSEEEIRQIAINSKTPYTQEGILQTLKIKQEQACRGIAIALAERYCEKQGKNESDWVDLETTIVFVHDKLTEELFIEIFEKRGIQLPEDFELKRVLKSSGAREAFSEINMRLKDKFTKLDQFDKPLPADVYRLN